MALSPAEATSIAQRLSLEQLIDQYNNQATSQIPGFILQSFIQQKLQERKSAQNAMARMPMQTVAEKNVREAEDSGGIASMHPQFQPQKLAKSGLTRVSPLDMGYSEDLPPEARKIIAMRLRAMKDLEQPDEIPQSLAEGGIIGYAKGTEDDTIDGGYDDYGRPDIAAEPPPITSGEIAPKNVTVSPQYIFNRLKQKGYSDTAAAAVAGNVQHEIGAGGGTGTVEKNVRVPGVGLSQWSPIRFNALKEYSKIKGMDPYNPDTQIDFIDHELNTTEKASGKKLFAANDLNSAHDAFLGFLRPRNYSSKNPSKTIAYDDRLAKARSILGIGSMRDIPEGADLPSKGPYIDESFLPQGVRSVSPPSYDYGTGQDNQAKGLSALRIAQAVNQMGRPPLNRNVGGPVFLQEGSEGSPTSSDLTPEPTRDYALDERERLAAEELNRKIFAERAAEEEKEKAKKPFGYYDPSYESPARKARRQAKSPMDMMSEAPEETTSEQFKGLQSTAPFFDGSGPTVAPPGWTPPPKPQAGSPRLDSSGIPSALPGGRSPFTGPEPAPGSFEYRTADETLKAMRERDAALRGPSAGGDTLTPRIDLSGDQKQDISFNTVMDQVKQSVGSNLSNEFLEQKKDFQKNLESMRNDKIVDTLMAAAKTFAGQRKGQFNIGDAVANAGLAAQEAQKRIYKAEDDMRKYRIDLLKAQDDGNYKAATIAMSRINNEETNRRGLQTAMIAAQKAHDTAMQTAGRYEKMYERQNKADAIRAINAEIIKNTPDPDKVDLQTPEQKKYLEDLKKRRDALVSGAESGAAAEQPSPTRSKEDLKSQYNFLFNK